MFRLILLATLAGSLLFAPMAASQATGYLPLQPGHSANWLDPAEVGEGFDIRVWLDPGAGRPVVMVQFYLLTDQGPRFYTAIEWTDSAWDGASYELRVFTRTETNTPGFQVGSAVLAINRQGELRLMLEADHAGQAISRDTGALEAVTPREGAIGRCGEWFSFPAPGPADPVWCHD